ncbi:hypothetical protein AJ79_02471 [Helicocarpus griseus UAMH5409]|uniref:Uncharacterized protein n=1 Tax=Helicocarpus griseus UAMH5409 TaxID=1447875 RepID=A0A2B7Y1G5_9EURO|nr:hypothetical protein AJ79_02471 [Helicocarpus griseus UAMH5409]
MQTLHDVSDKEAQEMPFSCGVSALFDAGTPCKPGGELQTRNVRQGHLSFHQDQALVMDDKQNFGPSNSYSEFGHPGSDLAVMFQDHRDSGLYTSSPSSPPQSAYKNSPSSPAEVHDHELNNHRAPSRKQSSHVELMNSSIHASLAMAYQSQWANRFQSYGIQAPDYRTPLATPSPLRHGHHDGLPRSVEQNSGLRNDQLGEESYERNTINHSQATPISMPCTGQGFRDAYVDQRTSTASTSPSNSPQNQHHILRSQPSEPSSMSSWDSEPINTPAFHYSTPDLQAPDNQAWWAPAPSPVHNRDLQSYSQSTYQPIVMAPTPQRPPIHQTRVLQGNNMMVQLGQSSDLGSPPLSASAVSCSEHIARPSYTPLAPGQEHISRSSPFADSNERHCTPVPLNHSVSSSNLKSPGLPLRSTPTNPTHRSPKPKPQLHLHSQHQHQRRNHIRKPSNLSTGSLRSPKGMPITPNSTPGKPPMSVSFVNFTPEDSQKLLTGVAPSGSSKTKARREREAIEKRRKLSEAALLAVKRAGGDVEALEAVFC